MSLAPLARSRGPGTVTPMVIEATTPLPELSADDRALLLRFIEKGTLEAMAASFKDAALPQARTGDQPWTLLDLYPWSISETIAPWLAFHKAQSLEARKSEALDELRAVARTAADPREKRRAATTILRSLGLGAQTRSSHRPKDGPTRVSDSPATTDAPPPAATDSPDPDPQQTDTDENPQPEHRKPTFTPYDWKLPEGLSQAPLELPTTDELDAARRAFFAHGLDRIETPPSCPRPHPGLRPQAVIYAIIESLRQVRMNKAGFITIFNYSGIEDRSPTSFEAFTSEIHKNFEKAYDAFRPTIRFAQQTGDNTYFAEAFVSQPRGVCFSFKIHLFRPTEGPLARCWLAKLATYDSS